MSYTDPDEYMVPDSSKKETPYIAQVRRRSGLPVVVIFALPGLILMFYPFYAAGLWSAGWIGFILAIFGFLLLLVGIAGFCQEVFNQE